MRLKERALMKDYNLQRKTVHDIACLDVNCPGVSNPIYCRRKFTCTHDDCNEAHNSLLHQGLVCPLSPPIESQTTATQEANYDFNIIANETKVDGTCLNNKEESSNTLLQIQTLKVGKQRNKLISINALWDAGSQLSFITFQLAKDLMLEGKPVALEIETVGGEFRKINS